MALPFFVTIPHSGEKVPDFCHWLQGLPEEILMCDVDRYVDRLYEPAIASFQLPSVKTEWHRYAADLNRVPEDIDADSVVGAPAKSGTHPRGFHWVITTTETRLMKEPMDQQTHMKLVDLIYEPFHRAVRNQYKKFADAGAQRIFHLDLHSMPSLGTSQHRDPGERRADIVVSDSRGKSALPEFVDWVMSSYARAGFKVAYNWPYFGGRVTEQYGRPSQGHHCVQVELNRSLYMNETTKKLDTERMEVLVPRLELALKRIKEGISQWL